MLGGGKWGYIDQNGNEVISLRSYFSNNMKLQEILKTEKLELGKTAGHFEKL